MSVSDLKDEDFARVAQEMKDKEINDLEKLKNELESIKAERERERDREHLKTNQYLLINN
jgi:hypothetical protein